MCGHTRRLLAHSSTGSTGTVDVDVRDDEPARRRSEWNTETTTEYAVGPDDAGNVVMHGIGFIVTGWRWLVGKITSKS
jgi:hypothetical protein